MTRIVIHPQQVGQYGERRLLVPPWQWWRARLYPDERGNTYYQQVDDPTEPREYSLLFNQMFDGVEIVDPPAMHLTTTLPEYDDNYYGGRMHSLMTRNSTTECDVVWHEQPGERWMQLPGNSCSPGEYIISDVTGRDRRNNDSTRALSEWSALTGTLRWPIDGQLDDTLLAFQEVRERTRREIAAIYNVPQLIAPSAREVREAIDSALREINPARAFDDFALEDYVRSIHEAQRDYQMQRYRRPVAVMIHPADYARLVRLAQQDEQARMGSSFIGDFRGVQPATVLGLEVRQDASMPRGQVLVVGDDVGVALQQFPRTYGLYEPGPLTADTRQRGGYSLNEIRALEGLPPMQPWQVGATEEIVRALRRSPNVLNPEDEVLDEIDLLVNDQVRDGPVDDFRVNRYPKCDECGHDFHGLDCVACGCINTSWLKEGKK